MKSIEIKGSLRKETGKKGSKSVRNEGNVPCEIYGKENVHFFAPELALKKVVFTPETYLVNITIDGKKYTSVMREIQFHPVTDKILHIDFEEVIDNKMVTVDLPINFEGKSTGVMAGGKLKTNLRKVSVRGLVKDIPHSITIDITNIGIGDSVRVKDLSYKGLSVLNAPNIVVVTVLTTRNVVADEAAAK